MIIVDELPFKFVEREDFQPFVSKACSKFRIPSRWTISRDCFKLYEDEKNLLMELLKSTNQSVSYYGYMDFYSKSELHVFDGSLH